MEFDDEIREFLIESSEGLATLDQDFVQLERDPDNIELVSNIFRSIHSIKGACGFFGFDILGAVAHITENILSQVRERKRVLTPELTSLLLEAVDTIRALLTQIETTGTEGEDETGPLQRRLQHAHALGSEEPASTAQTASAAATEVTVTQVEQASSPAVPEVAVIEMPLASLNPAVVREQAPEQVQISASEKERQAPESTAGTDGSAESRLAETTIRVDVDLLNRLMNLVGELVLARNQLLQETSHSESSLQQTSQRLNLITSELQESVMKTRMQPIGVVWNKLPRVVRDLAAKCGKLIRIEMEGAGTELDKTIIEAIKDPLTHIVRNSCDHGIELPSQRVVAGKSAEGTLQLRAYHEGGVVNIEISDDGAGIDPERVKSKAIEKKLIRPDQAQYMSTREAIDLIFLPGFSTASQVTNISGRGVGMDVVKTNIEKIGGNVEILQRAEGGTTLRIKIPLTLAIIPGLVVTLQPHNEADHHALLGAQAERFIIPQANLLELVRIEGSDTSKRIDHVHGTTVFHHRGKLLPLVYLSHILKQKHSTSVPEPDAVNIVVLQAENKQLGLVVDQICDTQEIVVKPLGRQLKQLACYVGATIMGDGQPALILDAAGLYRLAGLAAHSRQAQTAAQARDSAEKPQMLLLFSAGAYSRVAVSLATVDRIEDVDARSVEYAGGRPVLHYRGEILPLVTLDQSFAAHLEECSTIQVVVFTNGTQRVGLIVDQILDIVSERITGRRAARVHGLLGSAVIGGQLTDLLDLHAVVQLAGENWLQPANAAAHSRHKLVLIDDSTTAREMLSDYLESRGYDVFQSSSFTEAKDSLNDIAPNAVLLSSKVSASEKKAITELLNGSDKLAGLPVVELLENSESEATPLVGTAHISRSEREQLLEMVAALVGQTAPLTEVVQ